MQKMKKRSGGGKGLLSRALARLCIQNQQKTTRFSLKSVCKERYLEGYDGQPVFDLERQTGEIAFKELGALKRSITFLSLDTTSNLFRNRNVKNIFSSGRLN